MRIIVWFGLILFVWSALARSAAPIPQEIAVSPAELPARGKQTAYLEIPAAGRYAIGAHSKTGVALELVDYMSGPVARDGVPGQRDGRLDRFLDRGRYKLILHGAPQAQDSATVEAKPFAELQATPQRLPPLEPLASDLGDYQQRSYWLEVKERGPVFLEAGGRFLDALHLWRDGSTLLDVTAERRTLEPQAGRPLTVLTLDTVLDPGFYRMTLYGGREQTPWTQQSEDKPLYLRLGVPRIESATRQWRAIGPLGSDRFIVATPASDYGRLELPVAADVRGETATVERGGAKRSQNMAFAFTKKTRLPVWETMFDANADRLVTVQGRQGQGYIWQNFKRVWGDVPQKGGQYWLDLISAGDERDHLPATAVLAWPQSPKDLDHPNWQILASNAPRFDGHSLWRGRFNLPGPTELFVEIVAAGEYEIQTQGVPLTAAIKPLLAADHPSIKPRSGPRWTLETGFYRLELTPEPGQRGIVEMVFQSAGLAVDAGKSVTVAAPRFPSLQVPDSTRLFLNQRPQVPVGLLQRDLPVSLKDPLFMPLAAAAENLELNVTVPAKGALTAWDEQGQARSLTVDDRPAANRIEVAAGQHSVRLTGPAERGGALSLQWQPDPVPPEPLPAGLGQVPQQPPSILREEQPLPLDLVADRDPSVVIEVREPGLFRLETDGRLRTQGRLRTHLMPRLAEAEGNGVGHNFLIQNYLRAGHYLLSAGSRQGTAGHARLWLRRAPLRDGGTLRFDAPTRATLAAGEGAVYRFVVPPPGGAYRLQAVGLAQNYPLRLEDEEGWPILSPGQTGSISAELEAGTYRLVVMPTDVAGRLLVNTVAPMAPPALSEGHGPHPLNLNDQQAYRWLEPTKEGEARVPDQWTFALTGETDLRLNITDGMRGELQRLDDAGQWQSVGRLSDRKAYRGRVPAGQYRLLAEALGRNNQLDYTLGAWTEQLQPDQPRLIDELPAKIFLSVAEDRVVEIASLGRRDVRATLRDAAGQVLVRNDDRADGWDFLISRQLKAGRYELTVEEVSFEKDGGDSDAEPDESTEESEEADEEVSTEEAETDDSTTKPTVRDGNRNDSLDEKAVWVALRLPGETAAPTLPPSGDVELADGTVRIFPLADSGTAGCQLFAARSAGELTLALEERETDGGWRVLDAASGRSAWLAVLPGTREPERRLRVWGNDGGKAPILLQSRALSTERLPLGKPIAWERIAGIEPPLGVALVELPAVRAVRLPAADPTLRGASQPGEVLQAAPDDTLIPQSRQLWLLKPVLPDESLTLVPVTPTTGAATVQLTVPAGRAARLPAASVEKDRMTFWQVDSRFGQPGIDAGNGMGVAADHSAVAVALAGSTEDIQLWRADTPTEALPVVLRRHDLRLTTGQATALGMSGVQLATGEARRLRLPAGHKRLRLDLPARTVAVLGWGDPKPLTLWTGDRAISFGLDPETETETLLLANLGESSAPASWSLAPLPAAPDRLTPGALFRRFEPTTGVLLLQAEGRAGLELIARGQAVSATALNADGSVRRGDRIPLAGPAYVLLEHGPGLLAAWLAGEGSDPWPRVPAEPVRVPSVLALRGPAQALQVEFDRPVMLYGRGSAPLLAGVRRDGRAAAPALYPQGARFAHYLPPGRSELLLMPPQEGELAGVLELQASDVQPLGEGLGQPLLLAPGSARLFGFRVAQTGPIGVGVQATPDVVTSRLLNEQGELIGEGLVQMPRLAAGNYVLEVTAPPTGSPVQIRPAVVGIEPPAAGPPPEIRRQFRAWLDAQRPQSKKTTVDRSAKNQ